MSDETTRARVAAAIKARGAAAVARTIGVPRNSLLSYVAGAALKGTEMRVEAGAPRLDAPADVSAA